MIKLRALSTRGMPYPRQKGSIFSWHSEEDVAGWVSLGWAERLAEEESAAEASAPEGDEPESDATGAVSEEPSAAAVPAVDKPRRARPR